MSVPLVLQGLEPAVSAGVLTAHEGLTCGAGRAIGALMRAYRRRPLVPTECRLSLRGVSRRRPSLTSADIAILELGVV
jgi:hypothetical protein